VRDGQTSPHRPRLVVSRSTCPPLSPPPHANSIVIGPAVIKHTHTSSPFAGGTAMAGRAAKGSRQYALCIWITWARRPDMHHTPCYGAYGLAGPMCVCSMYVDHMGAQARYGRAGPICLMYSNKQQMSLQARQGSQAVCIMYMDHMSSQARYTSSTIIWIIWARKPDVQGREVVWACSPDMHHVA
jgi:hypothetical protein